MSTVNTPRLAITYCSRCRWMLRSSWLAQEVLTTFDTKIAEVALIPSQEAGTFHIHLDDIKIWDRKSDDGFPEAKELKQRIRDQIEPELDLGHSDCTPSPNP